MEEELMKGGGAQVVRLGHLGQDQGKEQLMLL